MKRLTVALLVLALTGCGTAPTTETGYDAPKDGKAKAAAKKAAQGIGDKVRDGKFEFTVLDTSKRAAVGENQFLRQRAQGVYILVKVKVENIGDEPQMLDNTSQKLFDTKGRQFSTDTEAQIALDSEALMEDINPGNSVKGILVFDVPDGAKPAKLELHDSAFSGGVEVAL